MEHPPCRFAIEKGWFPPIYAIVLKGKPKSYVGRGKINSRVQKGTGLPGWQQMPAVGISRYFQSCGWRAKEKNTWTGVKEISHQYDADDRMKGNTHGRKKFGL